MAVRHSYTRPLPSDPRISPGPTWPHSCYNVMAIPGAVLPAAVLMTGNLYLSPFTSVLT